MKVVLSRKGFDSQYGGIASPILPDGRLIALPIPSRNDSNTLADTNHPNVDLAKLIADLSGKRLDIHTHVHLDPDLDRPIEKRPADWRPAFGQTGAAQGHLAKNKIGPSDIFLFFGWFRTVELYHGAWRYVRNAPDLHVMFGWLEIEEVLPIVTHRKEALTQYPWIASHPHVASPNWYSDKRNSLYVASAASRFSSKAEFGAGRFGTFQQELQLTKTGHSRSVWSLPAWFTPNGRPALSYHKNPEIWIPEGDSVTLRSMAKGQEFVLDGKDYPEVEAWISSVIQVGMKSNG